MSQQDGFDPNDPFGMWRTMRDANLDAWAKGMNALVNSETFSKAIGAQLDSYLAASAPFKQAVDQYMDAYLAQLQMPSRSEVISLAKRMTNLELRIDDMDARLDQILAAVGQPAAAAPSAALSGVEARMTTLEAQIGALLSALSSPDETAPPTEPAKPSNGRPATRARRSPKPEEPSA